jgi:nucleoside-diphosphate-sugar epimerase
MKFLVTGGAGFIGHNVVQQLEMLGHECVVVDSLTGYGVVPDCELRSLVSQRISFIEASVNEIDIRHFSVLKYFFTEHAHDADAVIHLAAYPRQKTVSHDPVIASQVMVPALVNLLELTKEHMIPRFVYVSSSMVYGDFNDSVTEDAVCDPTGHYGILKYFGENLVKDYSRRGYFDHVIVRPSAVYGERDVQDRVISKFITSALQQKTLTVKGADQKLDFTHVRDTAAGIVLAATSQHAKNQVFNITKSDDPVHTLKEAAEMIIDIVGQGTIEIVEKDQTFPNRGRLSIGRANDLIKFCPKVEFREGLKDTIGWFRESSSWKKQK